MVITNKHEMNRIERVRLGKLPKSEYYSTIELIDKIMQFNETTEAAPRALINAYYREHPEGASLDCTCPWCIFGQRPEVRYARTVR